MAAFKDRTKFIVYGAGAIGGTIGARLLQQGYDVTLIARGEHARVLRSAGMTYVSAQGKTHIEAPVIEHPDQFQDWHSRCVVLLCMKSQHTAAALEDLSKSAPSDIALVCAQNGVANEHLALRYFRRVYGMVVNLPALHLTPGEIVHFAEGHGGILDIGCYPRGVDETAVEIANALCEGGFSALADADIMRFKYAKLLLNLSNALQAGLSEDTDVRDLGALARREALACYAAASIECADKETLKNRQQGVYKMVQLPGYARLAGSSWQSVARGTGNIETEYLNGEICLLGRLHDVPTPVNDACLKLARALLRGAPAQSFSREAFEAL